MFYGVNRLYHPSHRVPDLEAADIFFSEVFGRKSIWRKDLFTKPDPKYPTYPTDYCIFTPIAEVFFDSIDPRRYVIDGVQRYETVTEPHLNGMGWAVDGIEEIYKTLVANGIYSTDQANIPADPDVCPEASFKPSKLFFTVARDSGLRYEFYPTTSTGSYDPRTDPSWTLPAWSEDDPLGIEFCSCHTILTSNLAREKKLFVDILGAKVIHQGKNQVRGTDSVYLALADAVFELATPTVDGSYAMHDWKRHEPEDTYHALTWKVRDLDKVAKHLAAKGVGVLASNETMIVTKPSNSLGIPWGFTTEMLPNDPRQPA